MSLRFCGKLLCLIMRLAQLFPAIGQMQPHRGSSAISILPCNRSVNPFMLTNQPCLVLLWIAVSQHCRVHTRSWQHTRPELRRDVHVIAISGCQGDLVMNPGAIQRLVSSLKRYIQKNA